MDKKLSAKCCDHLQALKQDLAAAIKAEDIGEDIASRILERLYSYRPLEISKADLQKRKRVKNSVPVCDRCRAQRANGEQCTRRRKEGGRFCGTHVKGTPHGEINTDSAESAPTEIHVVAQDIAGIIYFIDDTGNVYDPQDVHQNLKDPRVIARYTRSEEGVYKIVDSC